MEQLVKYLVSSLVDNKEAVVVTIDGENIKVSVAKDDLGKVIGRQGRTAKAIRTIVKAASSKSGVKYNVDILDKQN